MKIVEHRIIGPRCSGKTTSMVLQAKAFAAAGMKCLYAVPTSEQARFINKVYFEGFGGEVTVLPAFSVDLRHLHVGGDDGGYSAVFFDDVNQCTEQSRNELEEGLDRLRAGSEKTGFLHVFVAMTDDPAKPL